MRSYLGNIVKIVLIVKIACKFSLIVGKGSEIQNVLNTLYLILQGVPRIIRETHRPSGILDGQSPTTHQS